MTTGSTREWNKIENNVHGDKCKSQLKKLRGSVYPV